MSHEANNAAMRRYAAIRALSQAAKLIDLSVGVFAADDDNALSLALSSVRGVAERNRDDAPVSRAALPGDPAF